MKIKDGVILKDWVHGIIVPTKEGHNIEKYVPSNFTDKIYYVDNDCADIWEWSDRVYEYARKL